MYFVHLGTVSLQSLLACGDQGRLVHGQAPSSPSVAGKAPYHRIAQELRLFLTYFLRNHISFPDPALDRQTW